MRGFANVLRSIALRTPGLSRLPRSIIAVGHKYLRDESLIWFEEAEAARAAIGEIEASAANDMDLRSRLARIRLALPDAGRLRRIDPFSDEYRAAVLQIYRTTFGAPHDLEREGMGVDIEDALKNPFPFNAGSSLVTGRFVAGYGYLIECLGLEPGSRILEIGAGGGALTWFLARTGYKVTALDVNPASAAQIKAYCRDLPSAPEVVCADINTFEPNHRYDAIVFFESLHHLVEHAALLEKCKGWLEPDGKVALAAEPVVLRGSSIVPYPWGLRLDGESLRAMLCFGWIELGFERDYLLDLAARQGWRPKEWGLPGNPWAAIMMLRRS